VYEAKAVRPFLAALGGTSGGPEPSEPSIGDIVQELQEASPAERGGIMAGYLARELAAVMGLPARSDIASDVSFLDMGLDSLMAVQLRNRLQSDLGVDVPIRTFMEGTGVADLAAELSKVVAHEDAEGTIVRSSPDMEDLADGVADMSGEEVDDLLRELLQESGDAP
jgi:acyl carrier protein